MRSDAPTLGGDWGQRLISTCSVRDARDLISRQVFLLLCCKADCHYSVWNWGSGLLGKRALSQLLKFRKVMIVISFPFFSAPSALLLRYLALSFSWNHVSVLRAKPAECVLQRNDKGAGGVESSPNGRGRHGPSVLLDGQLGAHCQFLDSLSPWFQGKSFVLIITMEGLPVQRASVPYNGLAASWVNWVVWTLLLISSCGHSTWMEALYFQGAQGHLKPTLYRSNYFWVVIPPLNVSGQKFLFAHD